MAKLSDEVLMAYADGQLDEKRTAEIRQMVATDEEVRQRVALFRQSSALLQEVYNAPLREAVPQRLVDTVRQFKPHSTSPIIWERLAALFQITPGWRPAYAFVATVVLLIGMGLGYLLPRDISMVQPDLSIALKSGAFHQGLDTTASGQWFNLDQQGVRILPVATFRDKSNAFCRPYDVMEVGDQKTPLARGIACRNVTGQWDTRVYIAIRSMAPATGESPFGYIPAGADDHDLIMTIADQLMATPILSREHELELMTQRWRVKPHSK